MGKLGEFLTEFFKFLVSPQDTPPIELRTLFIQLLLFSAGVTLLTELRGRVKEGTVILL